MTTTLLLSTLASAALLFFWGALVYGGLLKSYFPKHFGAIARPKTDLKLWAVAIEKLLQGLLLSFLFGLFARLTHQPLLDGLLFGALIGALLEVTYFFSTWVNYRVDAKAVAVTTAFGFARMLLVGLTIGAIRG